MKTMTYAAIAALLTTTAGFAHEYTVGNITVDHPMAFETARTAKSGGGYLSITNAGSEADTLVAIQSGDVPKIMLHKSETDTNGIARMTHLEQITVPAGGTVALEPGGLHIMFMGLDGQPLVEGDTIDATLVFENAGDLDVTFNVEARRASDHSDMDHSMHEDGEEVDHSAHGASD